MENPSRVIKTTLDDYIKKETVGVSRKRTFFGTLMKQGRFIKSPGGKALSWKIRYKQNSPQWRGLGEPRSVAHSQKYQEATLPWKNGTITDGWFKYEELVNQGPAAIIKAIADIGKQLKEDWDAKFDEVLFVDGNAAANSGKLHGLDSCLGYSGNHANNYMYEPSDTYAGLSTVLGSFGGTWNGTWPDGYGSSQYDFHTPLTLDAGGSAWQASTKTWPNTCREVIRFLINNMARNGKGVDLIMLTGDSYRLLQATMDSKEQVNVGNRDSELHFGTGPRMYIDGIPIVWEYGMPSTTRGYGVCFDEIEVHHLTKQPFESDVEDFVWETEQTRIALNFFGNMKLNPRNLASIYD